MSRTIDYFSSESLRSNLRGKTVRGGVMVGVGQALCVVIGLAAVPLLAWLLDPEDFGLVAMVAFFTNFAAMFVQAGMSMATVQREEITHRQVSNLFWLAVTLGVLVALVMASLSPVISWFYNEPRLTSITLAMVVSYLISGLTIQHQALLRRGMQFNAIAVSDVASQFVGQGAAVAWAWRFYGEPHDYWALVILPLAVSATRMVVAWTACRWRPGLPSRGVGTWQMMAFGGNLTGTQFVNYLARNFDKALIGWYWGPTLLGYYERAYKLLLWPLQRVLTPMSNVAIPTLSRLNEDPKRFRRYFRIGVLLSSTVLVPIVVASIVLAEPIVLLLLGEEFRAATPIFLTLGPAALMATTAPATYWVCVTCNRVRQQLRATAIVAVLQVLGFVIGVRFGPIGVAASFSIVTVAARLPFVLYCFETTPLRLRDQLAPMARPAAASLLSAIALVLLRCVVAIPADPASRFALEGLAFGVCYPAYWLLLPGGRGAATNLRELVKIRRGPAPANGDHAAAAEERPTA